MIAVMAVAAVSANAQIYVGGGLGFKTSKEVVLDVKDAEQPSTTTISLIPEIGYKLNDNSAIGIELGIESKSTDGKSSFGFKLAPYYRHTFWSADKLSIFADVQLSFKSSTDTEDEESYTEKGDPTTIENKTTNSEFGLGVAPGIAYDLNDKFTMVAKIGWLGFKSNSREYEHGEEKTKYKAGSSFGLDLNNALSFSIFYNF